MSAKQPNKHVTLWYVVIVLISVEWINEQNKIVSK